MRVCNSHTKKRTQRTTNALTGMWRYTLRFFVDCSENSEKKTRHTALRGLHENNTQHAKQTTTTTRRRQAGILCNLSSSDVCVCLSQVSGSVRHALAPPAHVKFMATDTAYVCVCPVHKYAYYYEMGVTCRVVVATRPRLNQNKCSACV